MSFASVLVRRRMPRGALGRRFVAARLVYFIVRRAQAHRAFGPTLARLPILVGSRPLSAESQTQIIKPIAAVAGAPERSWSIDRPCERIVGGWRLERGLGVHRAGPRWLCWGERDALPRVGYLVDPSLCTGKDFAAAIEPLTRLVHAHIAGAEEIFAVDGRVWIIAPYCGSYDGLMTLAKLVTIKPEGRLCPREAMLVGAHLLGAIDEAWRRGLAHGPIGMDGVLVDRFGRALIELFGVEAQLAGADAAQAVRASIVGVARIVYELVTGLVAGQGALLRAASIARACPASLDAFLERGLGAGFESPAEAIAVLSAWRR